MKLKIDKSKQGNWKISKSLIKKIRNRNIKNYRWRKKIIKNKFLNYNKSLPNIKLK